MSPRAAAARIARAEWPDLARLAGAVVLLGVLGGLAGVYPVAFALFIVPLTVVALLDSRAAVVLVALSCAVVALGSVDAGFNLIPAYPLIGAGVAGAVLRREWRGGQWVLADVLLGAFLLVALAVSVGNLGVVPRTRIVDATGVNGPELRSVAQMLALLVMGCLYLLMRLAIRTERDVAAVVRGLVVGAGFVAAYAAYQVVGRELLDLPYTFLNTRRDASTVPVDSAYVRVNSTLTEASPLAQFMTILLFVGAVWTVSARRRPAWIGRRGALTVALIAFGVIVATLSKSAWVAVALCAPGLLLAFDRAALLRHRRWLLAGGIAFLAMFAFVFGVRGGFADPSSIIERERYVRAGYWRAAVAMVQDRPLGIGVGNYAFYYPLYLPLDGSYEQQAGVADGHNIVLEAAAEAGVLGGLLLAGFLVVVGGQALVVGRRHRRTPQGAMTIGLATAFAAGVTMHMTYSYFYFPFEWVLTGLLVSSTALLEPATVALRDPRDHLLATARSSTPASASPAAAHE